MRRNSSNWDTCPSVEGKVTVNSPFEWGIIPSLPLHLKELLQSRTVPGLCLLEKTLQKDIQLVLGWQHPQHHQDFAQQTGNSFETPVFSVS